jgi:photosystem II stability/assembly factor-like uncharacterized protein
MRYRRSLWVLAFALLAPLPAALAQDVRLGRQGEAEAGGSEPPASRERDLQRERAEYFLSGRTILGETPADRLQRAYQQKLALREKRQAAAAAAQRGGLRLRDPAITPTFSYLTWENLGPSPIVSDPTGIQSYGRVTGRVTALAYDPNDATANTLYVGTANGGVWKTTNAAQSDPANVQWQSVFDGQPSLAIGSIAVQPGGNVILVGTGEANNSSDSYYGIGILRSTDGGQTWTVISSANNGARPLRGLGFESIAFSTANNQIVVAAAASTIGAGNGAEPDGASGPNRGLYYSTDAGLNWFYATATDPGALTVAPGSTSAVVYNPVHGKFYAALRLHGVYESANGSAWTRMANQPGSSLDLGTCTTSVPNFSCPFYRASITVRPDTGDTWIVYMDSTATVALNGPGVYRLTGNNGSWVRLSEIGFTVCGESSGCGAQQGTYNIYLKEVPVTAQATDLYMGFVNLFKCRLNTSSDLCSAVEPGRWMNLTHVYGCNVFEVHPDQHAAAYHPATPATIYFGNDGGVYRTLTGSTILSSSCAGQNPFQNVNANLGSLSQFVSFSHHPTDASIVLGGLQDNGSPLLHPSFTASTTPTTWKGVNAGDGGYNAIDPGNPDRMFTSFVASDGNRIQSCNLGGACDNSSFTNAILPVNFGSDAAMFYMPYILDPANSARTVIGTCRVWRGAIAPVSLTAISLNLSTGTTTTCTAAHSKIRALAAGGPTSGGMSQVIYAGMSSRGQPLQGHVFVTTNAAGGTATWVDRTGSINPAGYDISAIAISPHDATGQTAYLTIMGFGVSHVFKTTNAGVNWTDITGDLPDAPATAVVVDPIDPRLVYVGTDVGVFSTADNGVSWAEVGNGLPNTPVTALRIFNSGGTRKLRASTYGRGVWQADLPTLNLTFSANTLSLSSVAGFAVEGSVVVTNVGNTPINITGVSATGAFSATSNCPAQLSPSASCTATVIFQPPAGGDFTGWLQITDNAVGSPHTVALSGNAFLVTLTLSRPVRPSRAATGASAQRYQLDLQSGAPTSPVPVSLECIAVPPGAACGFSRSVLWLDGTTQTVELTLQPSPRRAHRLRDPVAQPVRVRLHSGSGSRVITLPVTWP